MIHNVHPLGSLVGVAVNCSEGVKDRMELKLGDIIGNAGLDPSTARYIVASPLITGVPRAGKQGRHRRFNMSGAIKVALATWLAMSGYSLDDANWLCDETERIVRERTGIKGEVVYSLDFRKPWLLDIMNQQVFRVYRHEGGVKPKYQRIRAQPGNHYIQQIEPRAVALHRFDLTDLEILLMRNPMDD